MVRCSRLPSKIIPESSLIDISQATSISTCDIIETLASLNMIRMLEKDKLVIYRSQELLDEYREKGHVRTDVVQYDRKCLKIKSIPVTVPFESKCKKLKFDDNETAMTFLNSQPLSS